MTEQRYNKDAIEVEDAEPAKRESLSDMLDKKRAAALAAEEAAKRADQLDALDEQLNRPLTAGDLHRKPGGPDTDVIDNFFSDDAEQE